MLRGENNYICTDFINTCENNPMLLCILSFKLAQLFNLQIFFFFIKYALFP